MKIYILKIMFLFLFSFGINVPLAANEKVKIELISEDIDKLLAETELIRTKNFKMFSKNLDLISSYQNKFSHHQYCYFNFLDGFRMAYSGSFEKAHVNLLNLFDECKELNIQVRIKALIANLFVISGNYRESIQNLDFVLSRIQEIQDKTTKHYAYVISFIVYDIVNQRELSFKFIDLLLKDNPSKNNQCKGLVHKNRLFLVSDDKKNIKQNEILSAITKCKEAGDNLYAQILNTSWIKYKLSKSTTQNQYQQLLLDLLNVENVIENTQYQNLIEIKNSLLAQIYEKLNNAEKALEYATLTISGNSSKGSTNQKIESLQVLINYYEKQKDFEKANELLKRKNATELKVYTDKQAKNMAYQTVEHNNIANKQEIELLNQQNKVLALENNLAEKADQIQKLVILFLIVLTAFIVFWGLKHRRNQRVYKELSEHDFMTSVYNRNGLKKYTESLLVYSEVNAKDVGCAVFDLDFFKNINDRFGHATGDWVIKNVIKKCLSLGNSKATFGRLGGEEFAIILSDATKEELYVFCENCRNSINSLVTKESGHDFNISASFGMTTSKVSGLSYSTLLINADDALYQAKNNGRNNTVIYQTS